MKEGDIYHWLWRDEFRKNDFGAFQSYHCKSRIAVYSNGTLNDTFWSGDNDGFLDPTAVTLELQGNANEMTVLSDNPEYYRDSDLVSMKHSNNSNAPIYLKKGAKRDAETMQECLQHRLEHSKYKIESHKRTVLELSTAIKKIRSGDTSTPDF